MISYKPQYTTLYIRLDITNSFRSVQNDLMTGKFFLLTAVGKLTEKRNYLMMINLSIKFFKFTSVYFNIHI